MWNARLPSLVLPVVAIVYGLQQRYQSIDEHNHFPVAHTSGVVEDHNDPCYQRRNRADISPDDRWDSTFPLILLVPTHHPCHQVLEDVVQAPIVSKHIETTHYWDWKDRIQYALSHMCSSNPES